MLINVYRGEMRSALDAIAVRPAMPVHPPIAYTADSIVAPMAGSLSTLRALDAQFGRLELHGVMRSVPDRVRFWIAVLTGDLDAADAFNERVIAAGMFGGATSGDLGYGAHLALARGDLSRAAIQARDQRAQCGDGDLPMARSFCDLIDAKVAHANGETTAALESASRALVVAEQHGIRLISVFVLELLACIAGDDDDLERAARLLGACATFRERNGFAFRWPDADRRVDDLRGRLDASVLAQGASLTIEEAVEYAQRARGERGRPEFGWEALTPAEQRVVELAADGLSNRLIAAKLFVSVATVKTHLVHSYRKLGLESRTELIASAISRRGS